MMKDGSLQEIERTKQRFLDDTLLEYHQDQFRKPKRSTIHLLRFVERIIGDTQAPYTAIDVACGAGANMYHLSKVLKSTTWTGLDFADKFFTVGRPFLPRPRFRLVKGDLFQLDKLFEPSQFDLSFSIQTISWLPHYEEAVALMLRCTRRWMFVTSLFSDF